MTSVDRAVILEKSNMVVDLMLDVKRLVATGNISGAVDAAEEARGPVIAGRNPRAVAFHLAKVWRPRCIAESFRVVTRGEFQ